MFRLILLPLAMALEVIHYPATSQIPRSFFLGDFIKQSGSHFSLTAWACPAALKGLFQIKLETTEIEVDLTSEFEKIRATVKSQESQDCVTQGSEDTAWALLSFEISGRKRGDFRLCGKLEQRGMVCTTAISLPVRLETVTIYISSLADLAELWLLTGLEIREFSLPHDLYAGSSCILSIENNVCALCSERSFCDAACLQTSESQLQVCMGPQDCLPSLSVKSWEWTVIEMDFGEDKVRVCVGRLWKAPVCEERELEKQLRTIAVFLGTENLMYDVDMLRVPFVLHQSLAEYALHTKFSSLFSPARRLTSTHVSGFTLWPYMSNYDYHYFTFVNNHISATSIQAYVESHSSFWSCDGGCNYYDIPMQICLFKFWNGVYLVSWCTSGVPAALVLYPSHVVDYGGITGTYMLRVSANYRYFRYEVKVRIFCSNPSSLCSCSPGNYPDHYTTTCLACGGTDYYCQSYPMIGCLPYTFTVNTVSYSPTAFSCKTCYISNLVLDHSTGKCVNCDSVCASCFGTGVNQCASCYYGASLTGSVGFSSCMCDPGFFPNLTPAICKHCSSTCLTCSGGTLDSCVSCKPLAMLSAGSPSACRCADGYGGALDDCQPCDATCATCLLTSSNSCLTCYAHAALVDTAPAYCLCEVGYYPDPTSANCSACDSSCLTCVGGTASSCTSCKPNAELQASPGSCPCADGFYGDPCSPCDSTCFKCSQGGPGDCIACRDNAEITPPGPSGSCECMIGYFPSPTVSSCAGCHSTCLTCSTPGQTKCLTCKPNASLPSGATEGACSCDAPFIPSPTAALCAACHSSCSLCVGSSSPQCSVCFPNASLANGTNQCVCNVEYFPSPGAQNCQPCHINCRTCLSGLINSCTSCYEHATLVSGSCSCIAGTFRFPSMRPCLPCHKTCLECINGPSFLECTQCAPEDTFVNSNSCSCQSSPCPGCHSTCLTCDGVGISSCLSCSWGVLNPPGGPGFCECPTSFYPNTPTSCLPCDINCNSCTSGAPTDCTECFLHAVLSNGVVPSSCVCEYRHYLPSAPGDCLPCDPSCASCQDGTPSGCLSCVGNAKLSSSPSPSTCECEDGYYLAGSCVPCHYTCKTCSNGSDSGCLACFPNATKSATGSCECNPGAIPSPDVTSCSGCDPSCLTCSGPTSSDCTACSPTHAALKNGRSPGQCVCDPGYYLSVSTCELCDSACVTCFSSGPAACTSCHPRAHLQTFPSSACVCDPTFWPLPDVRNCLQCHTTCLTCSSTAANGCESCYLHAELTSSVPSACICSTGFYPAPIVANCLACFPSCKQCRGRAEFECTLCYSHASLIGSSPTTCQCDQGYYRDLVDASICHTCDLTCKACSAGGISDCTDCFLHAELASLAPSSCKCTNSHFPFPSVNTCVPCDHTCESCLFVDPSSCQTCHPHASLLSFSPPDACICDQYYFPDPTAGSCSACDMTCAVCAGKTAQDCLACFSPAEIVGGLQGPCICPDGYYPAPTSATCQLCHSTCRLCVGAEYFQCTGCYNNAVTRHHFPIDRCVCDVGYFPISTSATCWRCHPTCQECISFQPFHCTSCLNYAKLVLVNIFTGVCECQVDSFPDPDSSNCSRCHESCQTCVRGTENDCLSCYSEADISGPSPNSCLCKPGFFPNPSSADCQICVPICATCAAASECLSCHENAHLSQGTCECLEGFRLAPNDIECWACSEGCIRCSDIGCEKCQSGLYLYEWMCVSKCPIHYSAVPYGMCIHSAPPQATLSVIGDNDLIVSFDKPMLFTAVSALDLSILIADPGQKAVVVFWIDPVALGSQKLLVNLTIDSTYLNPGTQAILTFTNMSKIIDIHGIPITTESLECQLHPFGTPPPKQSARETPVATSTHAATQGAMAGIISLSIFSRDLTIITSLINQLQLMSYIGMVKLKLPTDFAATLIGLNAGFAIPCPFAQSVHTQDSGQTAPEYLSDYGISSLQFIQNTYSILIVNGLVLLAYLPIYLLSKLDIHSISPYFASQLPSLTWNTPLSLWLASYLDLGLYSFIQLSNSRAAFRTPGNVVSLVVALAFGIASAATPIAVFSLLYRNYEKILRRNDANFNQRWKVLFEELDTDKGISVVLFYYLFTTRRAFFFLSLALACDSPLFIGISSTFLSVSFLVYLFCVKPYANRLDQVKASFNEVSVLLVYISAVSFNFSVGTELALWTENIGVWTARVCVFANFVIPIFRAGQMIKEVIKEYVRFRRSFAFNQVKLQQQMNRGWLNSPI